MASLGQQHNDCEGHRELIYSSGLIVSQDYYCGHKAVSAAVLLESWEQLPENLATLLL